MENGIEEKKRNVFLAVALQSSNSSMHIIYAQ